MKFLSCNIEGNRHFERILPLLKHERPDLVALQEVFECDLEELRQATGLAQVVFYPQADIALPNDHLPLRGPWGVAIFANEIVEEKHHYYFGHENGKLAVFDNDQPWNIDRVALAVKARVAGQDFQVLTVHFTWSGEGAVNAAQRRDYLELSSFMKQFDEMIFCGDLNTPRGYEIWDDLAKKYTDNIPAEIDTTIDKNLHKSGKDIRLVIDALFTSSHYLVSNVRVLPDTSDHMAVVALVKRTS